MSLQFPIRACWMKRGQQKRLPAAAGPQAFQHLFGAYNWRTDQVHYRPALLKNSLTFIEFLEYLLFTVYPDKIVALVVDNVSYHRSAAVRAALSLLEHRLRMIYLPVYSPDLNLIERFWRHLKDAASANCLLASPAALLRQVERIVAAQNDLTCSLRLLFSKHFR